MPRVKEKWQDPRQLDLFDNLGSCHDGHSMGGFFIPEDVRQALLNWSPPLHSNCRCVLVSREDDIYVCCGDYIARHDHDV